VGVVTIVDNDPPSALSIDDLQRAEGTGGQTTFAVPVRLDRASGFAIVVPFSVDFGTARATDLTTANGSITIPVGQMAANINVLVTADKIAENKETFIITLGQPSNASIADGQSTASIVDDDFDTLPPQVAAKTDVVVEVRMALSGAVVVSFANPSAVDNIDRALPTTCVLPSGAKFPYGRTVVRCTAEDSAGNVGQNNFGVVVQTPTVPGAVFGAGNPGGPALTEIRGGQPIEVRVNAGAFDPKTKVAVSLIDANGRSFDLGTGKANNDGSFEFGADVPAKAALGVAQILAQSDRTTGSEYDRSWLLTVLPR
jgi:hypothetical protein